ncbi:right-handed parallel beta-helix repeat-containing protein [Marinomonas sp. 2405UD68-3]|uniref:right-handed parallel beta-helix repeat-containing protein n=1 Tax=Marinomonas sp. 2405UD68-3 TaxID=3391835 RepID=UPI0039C9E13C
MTGVSIHDNYIHDVGGEGMYVGHGFYQGRVEKGCDSITYPHSVIDLSVYNNRIENTGFDGIQIKNADNGAKIFNNYIRNYGTRDHGAHNEGLFVGDGSEAQIFRNWIELGTGHGMQINAFGNTSIYQNIVLQSNDDGLYLNNSSAKFANKDGIFRIYENTFIHTGDDGIVAFSSQEVVLTDNKFGSVADKLIDGKTVLSNGNVIVDEPTIYLNTLLDIKKSLEPWFFDHNN